MRIPRGAKSARAAGTGQLMQADNPDAVVSNITHWAYGMLSGAAYSIAAKSLGQPRTWHGLPFGASVWAASYTVLPAAGLYKPIRDYDRETLAKDLSAHLVYGTATAVAERLLSP